MGDVDAAAPALEATGTDTYSTDEMTGVRAPERAAPTRPMRPGQVERRAFEDERHGTLSLIATVQVATGAVVAPSIGPTRTAADVAAHSAQPVALDPEAGHLVIVDHLNSHQSERLVRLVAEPCALPDDLGITEHSGILLSMATRAAFLSDPTHRIQFVSIPTHTSWLNQVEIWFSILVRRGLTRGTSRSTEELGARLLAFIADFNQTLAKPFTWTYAGRPLVA